MEGGQKGGRERERERDREGGRERGKKGERERSPANNLGKCFSFEMCDSGDYQVSKCLHENGQRHLVS